MFSRRLMSAPRRASRIPSLRVPLRSHRPFATDSPISKSTPGGGGGGGAIQHTISNSAAQALTATGRFFKWTLLAGIVLGISVATAVEGTHQYVEHWGMKPEKDEDVKKYEWHLAAEHFHGNPQSGGTDAGLGFFGRHALRSAWQVTRWGLGSSEIYAATAKDTAMLPSTDFVALEAAHHLGVAIGIAEQRLPHLHPNTFAQLLDSYASYCERLGGQYLPVAYASYYKAWEHYGGRGTPAGRAALRMGDISLRLGQPTEAQKWWKTAVQVCQGPSHSDVGTLSQPTYLPTSPWAQRTLASTLVSISAYYAQTGKLEEAETFEVSALEYLRSIPTPSSLSVTSAPQALHFLFLLQRSSLLSIHLAEVLHARKRPLVSSIQWLTAAAESSERVARALTGLPPHTPGLIMTSEPPAQDVQTINAYSSSPNMKNAASRLLTDAKRTSAEAWSLLGVLYEQKEGPSSKIALQCYQRASQWSSAPMNREASLPDETVKESPWQGLWSKLKGTSVPGSWK